MRQGISVSSDDQRLLVRPRRACHLLDCGTTRLYELIGDGVFGFLSLLGCHDVCPKNLPLSTQIAFIRRKMAAVGWK